MAAAARTRRDHRSPVTAATVLDPAQPLDADRDDGTRYLVGVRALCEFTARSGDLDLRFTPSATALEGIAGHVTVAARRGPDYESEIALRGEHGPLILRGRADGYDPVENRLDEVKTHRGDLSLMPANRRALHRAQAEVYGALLCRARGLETLDVALVYFDVASGSETVLRERYRAADLEARCAALCERFVAWARQELAHRQRRDAVLGALRFPHTGFRTGQRDLSEAVYKATVAGRCLLAQAPTGIGKTVGTLYPVLRAWPGQRLDKLCFLTAKTTGRALALDALDTLQVANPTLPLRRLELVARDKACEHPDKACHGAACPLARGFFDRLPAARSAALAEEAMDKATLRRVALDHQVCPYHLGQDLVRWADVVVGDYNHWFDGSALLHGLSITDGWRTALLVDEAHNLVDRARAMYSAELQLSSLQALHALAPPALRGGIGRVARAFAAMADAQREPYAVHEELPAPLQQALQACVAALGEHLLGQVQPEAGLLQGWFDLLHFARLLDGLGAHTLLDLQRLDDAPGEPRPGRTAPPPAAEQPLLFDAEGLARDARLSLRNVVPAPHLKARFAACHSATLFSGTLRPFDYLRELLGLPADTATLEVASPFGPQQLRVRVADTVSTRHADRPASVAPIARLIARQYAAEPGNYLAFFSSFDYLQRVADHLAAREPALPIWRQERSMDEAARSAFLARFRPEGRGVAFAVLGGAFGEGIDLPGRRLIGAFVATLGLPQWSPVNEQMRTRLAEHFGAERGHDYTYLVPGLQKVAQAAGRVIRSASDRGVLWLIDDRYRRPKVRRLLPEAWWIADGPDREPAPDDVTPVDLPAPLPRALPPGRPKEALASVPERPAKRREPRVTLLPGSPEEAFASRLEEPAKRREQP
jgi:DNA excision repair protein ERCC-2